jgi:hypothetical protein
LLLELDLLHPERGGLLPLLLVLARVLEYQVELAARL